MNSWTSQIGACQCRWLAIGLALAATCVAGADRQTGPAARLIASPELGWPQWRGPRRDAHCEETGLLRQWPEGGPKLLWKIGGLGKGYSTPIFSGERLYLTGDTNNDLRITAFDLTGQVVWQAANGRSWNGPYPGARAACTFSEGKIYHLNAHGRAACLDAATGRELWAVNILERFGGSNLTWALSECLLVDGPRVLVTPGGTQALMAALDKKTGATVWSTEPLLLGPSRSPTQQRLAEPVGEADSANYASPVLYALGNRRLIAGCSLRHAFGVDADTGKLVWTVPHLTRYQVVAATPIPIGDAVFFTAPDTTNGGLYRLVPAGMEYRPEKVWGTSLDTCHGGLVVLNEVLYGSYYRKPKGWTGLDVRTGDTRGEVKDLPMGSVLYADGHLYCLSQEGDMALLKPSANTLELISRFRLTGRVSDCWPHPVIFQKRLYLRYHDTLYCYDIAAAPVTP